MQLTRSCGNSKGHLLSSIQPESVAQRSCGWRWPHSLCQLGLPQELLNVVLNARWRDLHTVAFHRHTLTVDQYLDLRIATSIAARSLKSKICWRQEYDIC